MRSCPQCRLLLELLEWNGRSLLVCRSCGGIWLSPDDLAPALEQDKESFRAFVSQFPGVATPEAFAGLMRPCPECRTVWLVDGPVPGTPEVCVAACPKCGGVWLDAKARAAVAGPEPARPPETAARTAAVPAPPLELQIAPGTGPEPAPSAQAAGPEVAAAQEAPPLSAALPLPFVVPEPSEADVLAANASFAAAFPYAALPPEPARHVAVLTCMDSRIPVLPMLGLNLGDAHVLRNAGALATDDALRSMLISHHLLGTQEIYIVGHTDCGMTHFRDDDLLAQLKRDTGISDAQPHAFLSFRRVEESVRDQVMRVRIHPWLEGRVTVRGFLYDVETGRLSEVA